MSESKHAVIRYKDDCPGFSMSRSMNVLATEVKRTVALLTHTGHVVTSIVYTR